MYLTNVIVYLTSSIHYVHTLLSPSRDLGGGYWLVGIQLDIPKSHITSGLEYKYVVIRGGKKGEQIREKFVTRHKESRILHESTDVLPKQRGSFFLLWIYNFVNLDITYTTYR